MTILIGVVFINAVDPPLFKKKKINQNGPISLVFTLIVCSHDIISVRIIMHGMSFSSIIPEMDGHGVLGFPKNLFLTDTN